MAAAISGAGSAAAATLPRLPQPLEVFWSTSYSNGGTAAFSDPGNGAWNQLQMYGNRVASGSRPVSVTVNGRAEVFFVDAAHGNTITRWWWNPTDGWKQQFFWGSRVAAGTSPAVTVVDGMAQVFFVDATRGNTITKWEWDSVNGYQQQPFWGGAVAPNSSPAAVTVGGKAQVFFADASRGQTITRWGWDPVNGWKQAPFWGSRVADGTSPAVVAVPGGEPEVFFSDATRNQTITAWAWNGTQGWHQVPFYGSPVATGTSPAAVLVEGRSQVYYADGSRANALTGWKWDPVNGWKHAPLGSRRSVPGTSPAAVSAAGLPHIVFADAENGNTLSEMRWTPAGGWQQRALWGGPVAAGTSPTITTLPNTVNQPGEADPVIATLRSTSDAEASALIAGLSAAERHYVATRAYQTMWASAHYGGANYLVDNDGESGNVIGGLQTRSDSDAGWLFGTLSQPERDRVTARGNQVFPSTVRFGGSNWKVDSAGEADAFIAAFRGAPSDAAANDLYNGLATTDRGPVDARLAANLVVGELYRDPGSGAVWVLEDAGKAWIVSDAAAEQFAYDLSTASRVTPAAMATRPNAPNVEYSPPLADDGDDGNQFLEDNALQATIDAYTTYTCSRFTNAEGNLVTGSTIRNAGQKYAIGFCDLGTKVEVSGKGQTGSSRGYVKGYVQGGFGGCGFIQSGATLKKPSPGIRRDCNRTRIMEGAFASKIAIDGNRPDGGPNQNRVLVRACARYMNVNFGTDARSGKLKLADGSTYYVQPGSSTNPTRVQVRYITRVGTMVMTRWGRGPNPRWAFMEKSCFADMPVTRNAYANKPGNSA